MHAFHTIVVAVDFSETSTDTIEMAVELARDQPHRIHLLHVVADVHRTLGVTEAPGVDWAEVQRGLIDQGRTRLVELASACRLDPRQVTIAVETGTAVAGILRYADEHDAQMLVLGSHGHGIVRRVMLGSVAERVLRLARCPVVLVPHRLLRLTTFEVKAASGVES